MRSRGFCLFVLFCLSFTFALSALSRLEQLPGYNKCDHTNRICSYYISVAATRIRPDGYPKIAYIVNNTIPGPTLYGFQGYRMRVTVKNRLDDIGITIHFHGQNQLGTPFYDGVAYVSQCPIPPQSTFTHYWYTDPAGTGWYHSHSGLQYPEGIYGPMIIYETDTRTNPYWGLYDGELVYLINDWYPMSNQYQRFVEFQNNGFEGGATSDLRYQSILINGRGRCQPVPYFPDLFCEANCTIDKTDNAYKEICQPCTPENHPLDWQTVQKGKTYRVRLINGGSSFGFRVSIDKHQIRVIAQSQGYVQETPVESIVILPGERYDFLVTADQPIGNYYFRVEEPTGKKQLSVFHYEGANMIEPPLDLIPLITQEAKLVPYFQTYQITADCCGEALWPKIEPCCNATMGEFLPQTFRGVRLSGGLVPQKAYKTFNFEILGSMKPDYYLTINNIINLGPSVPYMFSKGKFGLPEEMEYHTTGPLEYFNMTWVMKAHFEVLEYRRVYDIIWLNKGPMLHPLHLHGHRFWLLGSGPKVFTKYGPGYNFTNNFCPFGSTPGDEELLNFVDPPFVDTAVVPPKGWLYLRFIADNPGPWFYHCHIETHVAAGMGVVFLEALDRWPALPDDMVRCGSSPVISPVRNVESKRVQNGKKINLSWEPPEKGHVNNYEVQYKPSKGCNIPIEDSVLTEETEITVTPKKEKVEYEFTIRAKNFMNGESPAVVIKVSPSGKASRVTDVTNTVSRTPRRTNRRRTAVHRPHKYQSVQRNAAD